MILETKRLIIRPWKESDAESLYRYAKDERIGPAAGWPVHKSIEYSRYVIENIFSVPETYAVCIKETDEAVGCIGLIMPQNSNISINDGEAEVGYWIGAPFWGKGLIPEALEKLMEYAFCTLKLTALWCGYFDGNTKSERVQKKCGFKYVCTNENVYWQTMDYYKTEHISRITAEEYFSQKGDISE